MVETVRRAEYFYTTVEDKPGEARRLLEFCSAHEVHLMNFTAFPTGHGKVQLDFFAENVGKLQQAAQLW